MADHEYIGCIHVHTTYSDGASTVPEILAIAAEVGLDYLAISDHRSDACREGRHTGWHGRLLCMSAPEIGLKAAPHFLMFCPKDIKSLEQLSPGQALAESARRGSVTLVAHPHPAELKIYKKPPAGWTHLERYQFDAIEIWSYLHDICHKLNPWRLARFWMAHQSLVHGPRPETLRVWDDLCRTRRVAGLGALDNHATRLPLVGPTLPHGDLFRLHRTHVLCPTLSEDGEAAEREMAQALASGRAFVAMDGWGDAMGFRLRAEGPGLSLLFGDEAAFTGNMRLIVTSPRSAELIVLRDGMIVERRTDVEALELPLDRPGVYRVEARLAGRPWVFTNPIYLRDASYVPGQAPPQG